MSCPVRDTSSSRDPLLLHPKLRQLKVYLAAKFRRQHPDLPTPFITQSYRNCADQTAALNSGKSKARYGQSLHNAVRAATASDGMGDVGRLPRIQLEEDGPEFVPCAAAFDVAFLKEDGSLDWSFHLFEKMGELAEAVGLEWGGRWPSLVDGPHIQARIKRGNRVGLPYFAEAHARLDELKLPDDFSPVVSNPVETEDGWLHVLMVNGEVKATTPIKSDQDVVQRIAPHKRRLFTDIRSR